MAQMTYMEALRDGMRMEMRRDRNVFLAGEDVGFFGGCFGQTAGLFDEFGKKSPETAKMIAAIRAIG